MIADLKKLAGHVHEAARAATNANIAMKHVERERELLFKSVHEARMAAFNLIDVAEGRIHADGPKDWNAARDALITALLRLPAVQPGVDYEVEDYNGVHEH